LPSQQLTTASKQNSRPAKSPIRLEIISLKTSAKFNQLMIAGRNTVKIRYKTSFSHVLWASKYNYMNYYLISQLYSKDDILKLVRLEYD